MKKTVFNDIDAFLEYVRDNSDGKRYYLWQMDECLNYEIAEDSVLYYLEERGGDSVVYTLPHNSRLYDTMYRIAGYTNNEMRIGCSFTMN